MIPGGIGSNLTASFYPTLFPIAMVPWPKDSPYRGDQAQCLSLSTGFLLPANYEIIQISQPYPPAEIRGHLTFLILQSLPLVVHSVPKYMVFGVPSPRLWMYVTIKTAVYLHLSSFGCCVLGYPHNPRVRILLSNRRKKRQSKTLPFEDVPGGLSVKTMCFHCKEIGVRFLVGEQRCAWPRKPQKTLPFPIH